MSKESSPRDTMHRRDFNKLLSAAIAGMVGAGALAGCRGTDKDDRGGAPAADKHACKGLNDCKGKGGCKTDTTYMLPKPVQSFDGKHGKHNQSVTFLFLLRGM